MKGVNVLASSLLEWNVQLFPPYTLNSKVSKAASAEDNKQQCIEGLGGKFKMFLEKKKGDKCDVQPVASVDVRIDDHHADAWTTGAVFTHKAVWVRPVWGVFGHQGSSDCDLF